MTTEVLRNMIYADSDKAANRRLDHLGYVVMDEIHYLADRFRGGAVWEEVILQLPEHVAVWWVSRPRSATPRSSATGWSRSGATPASWSTSTARCRCGST